MLQQIMKLKENVTGKLYVDSRCIDCDLCRLTAPTHFSRNHDAGYSYVSKQPRTPEEDAVCLQARLDCPVEAIVSDDE